MYKCDICWPLIHFGLNYNDRCQGQPRVIIYTYNVELQTPMLNDKFQDHRTFRSGEEYFKVLTIQP